MARCYICEGLGINTVADSPEPIIVNDKKFKVCIDCHSLHVKALDRGLRTMFDRLFPDVKRIRARADTRPRAKSLEPAALDAAIRAEEPAVEGVIIRTTLTIFPVE